MPSRFSQARITGTAESVFTQSPHRLRFLQKLELETQPEAYLPPSVPCSRASMVTAPVRDRESDDVRLRRE